jgi:hypothetical protein
MVSPNRVLVTANFPGIFLVPFKHYRWQHVHRYGVFNTRTVLPHGLPERDWGNSTVIIWLLNMMYTHQAISMSLWSRDWCHALRQSGWVIADRADIMTNGEL